MPNYSQLPQFDEWNDNGPPSTSAQKSNSGSIGVANPSPAFAPEHNPSKSILGGDNRANPSPNFAPPGNPAPGAVMGSGDSIADLGLHYEPGGPTRKEVAKWMRGGNAQPGGAYRDCTVW